MKKRTELFKENILKRRDDKAKYVCQESKKKKISHLIIMFENSPGDTECSKVKK
jgi:hypothetical protein